MNILSLSKSELVDELDLPDSAIEDRILHQARWSTTHEIIFKREDRFFRTTYRVGSTENQPESPWEFDKIVNCTEVHQVPKTVMMWEPV